MKNLDQRLVDDFQAVAIILAMATVFFGIQYQKALDTLSKTPVDGTWALESVTAEGICRI
jgi:hypothetical protein